MTLNLMVEYEMTLSDEFLQDVLEDEGIDRISDNRIEEWIYETFDELLSEPSRYYLRNLPEMVKQVREYLESQI